MHALPGLLLPDMDIESLVGQNIRRLRLERGLTQEALAFDVGVAARHLGRIERGSISSTIGVLSRIAQVLECPLTRLVQDDESAMPPNLPRGRYAGRSAFAPRGVEHQAPYQLQEPPAPDWEGPDPGIEQLRRILLEGARGKYMTALDQMIAEMAREAGGEQNLTEAQRENIRLARAWALAKDTEDKD